jgi:hypothetical protein
VSYRYRNTQSVRIRIPDLGGVEVDPGEEFDSEQLLNNATLVPADTATQTAQDARDEAVTAEAEPVVEPPPAPVATRVTKSAPASAAAESALVAEPDATPQEAPAS